MSTRLSRLLLDQRAGAPGVNHATLETIVTDFRITRWGRWLMRGEITVDDLNGTRVKRASIAFRNGMRFALSGLEELLTLRVGGSSNFILLTMVSCRNTCHDPDWCDHPGEVTTALNAIRNVLQDEVREHIRTTEHQR